MKSINATLQTGLLSDALDLVLRLTCGAVVITIDRIINWESDEYGRLGAADLIIDIDNSDGTYSTLATLLPRSTITTERGLVIAGTTYYQADQTWQLLSASNSSFGAFPKTIHLEARNGWDKFHQLHSNNLAWTGEDIGTLAGAIAAEYGVTLTHDASLMWDHVLAEWSLPKNLSAQLVLGLLLGDSPEAHARAYGRFESNGDWYLKSFLVGSSLSAAPAADASLGDTGTPAIYDVDWLYKTVPTRFQINAFDGVVAGTLTAIEALSGVTDRRVVNARRLLVAGTVHRAGQETIELTESRRSARLLIQPDFRLQPWDTEALYNAAGVTDATVWHITRIEFAYRSGSVPDSLKDKIGVQMWITVRECASSSAYTDTTPIDPVGGASSARLDRRLDTLRDDFDEYGGTELAQSGSSGLNWLAFDLQPGTGVLDTTHFVEGIDSVLLDNTLDAEAEAIISPAVDMGGDGRWTADDFICMYAWNQMSDPYFKIEDSGSGYAKVVWTFTYGEDTFIAVKRSEFVEYGINWAAVDRVAVGAPGIDVIGDPGWFDDLRIVKADPDDPTTFNDTGRAWDFFGAGVWHIYQDVTDIPFALGQIKTDAGTRYVALRAGEYVAENHFACGLLARAAGVVGLIAFAADKDNCYEIRLDTATNTVKLYKRVAGTDTLLDTATKTIDTDINYTVGIKRDGNYLSVYVSAVGVDDPVFTGTALLLFVDDDTFMGGKIGVVSYGINSRFFQVRAGSPEHALTAEYAYESDRLDGYDASDLALAGHAHAHADLTAVTANQHHTEDHDHDGSPTQKLTQANTHESPDTDADATSLHHTLGASANQAAAGDHSHAAGDATTLDGYDSTEFARLAAVNTFAAAQKIIGALSLENAAAAAAAHMIRRMVYKGGLADNVATEIFKITTTDEAGSTDGGAYTCMVRALIGHIITSGAGSSAAKNYQGQFTRVVSGAGVGITTPVEDVLDGASVSTNSAQRDIGVVAMTTAESSEYDTRVSFQIDLTGSAVSTAMVAVEVVLIWSGFLTAPVITGL